MRSFFSALAIAIAPPEPPSRVITATIGYFGNRTKEEQEEFVRRRMAPSIRHGITVCLLSNRSAWA